MKGVELTAFIEEAPNAMAIFDRDMRYMAFSPSWLSYYKRPAIPLGFSHYDIFPETTQRAKEVHRRSLAGETLRGEDCISLTTGELLWVQWEIRPWREMGGVIGGVVITTEDITLRKAAEATLERASSRLEMAQSAAQIGVWDWDIRENGTFVNDQWRSIFGISHARPVVTYDDFVACLHPDDRDAYLEMVNEAFSGTGYIEKEARICRADDGAIRWVASKGKVIFNEEREPTRAMGALWDITSLKEAQDALLQRSEDRYRTIIETAQEGIWLLDAEAKTTFVNPKMADLLGYSPQEMLGRHLLDFVDAEWRPVAEDKLIERGAGAIEIHDFKFRRKDGSDLWALLSCKPIFEGASYKGALAMVMDFTERMRLEQERQRYLDSLKEMDRRKNEFLATLGHELRTPLQIITLAMDLIEKDTTFASKLQKPFSRMQRQVEYLARMVDDILHVSRHLLDEPRLERENIDLNSMLENIADSCRSKIEDKGVNLRVSLAEHVLPINADTVRLSQVFNNLLDNAAKFSDEGGTVDLLVSREDDQAVVTVCDQGIGIAEERLTWIFDLFAQIRTGSEKKRDGIGVGLALARKFVELHGGSIEARSDDLPLNFHPAAIRVSAVNTPEGADVATGDRRSWSGLSSRSPVAVRLAAYSAGVA